MALREDRMFCDIVNSCAPCRRAARATQIVASYPPRGGTNVSLPRTGAKLVSTRTTFTSCARRGVP